MHKPVRNLLLIAGRLGIYDDGWPITAFLDRLTRMGFAAQVLSPSAAGLAAADPRVVECPGLASRWLQFLAIRNVRLGEPLRRPELMHVLSSSMAPVGIALAERWQIPYVQTIDEFVPPDGRVSLSRSWCRRLIASSRELADDLIRTFSVPRALLSVVPRGITMTDNPVVFPASGHVPVIGTAGPLVASSGFVTFLNAARRVLDAGIDAEFVIAGQGEDEVDLRRRAERLRIADRVTFVGIPVLGLRYWSVLDMFCQTSLVPTVGRTLAMALSFGVPSVASDIEGLRELVAHEETGLRVTPDDSSSLARAVLTLLADRPRALSLGAAAREVIRRDFLPDLEIERLAAIYGSILASSEGRLAPPALSPRAVPVDR